MTGGVTTVLMRAGKIAAGAVTSAALVRLGLPALGALVFLVALAAGIACWVLGSDARTARVTRMLLAWRGNPSCLPPGGPAAPGPGPRRP